MRVYHIRSPRGYKSFTFTTAEAAQDYIIAKDLRGWEVDSDIVWESAEQLHRFLYEGGELPA